MNKSNKLIDFHSHILPRADHGSDSVETSFKQLEILEENNVGLVLATPHFYPFNTSPERFIAKRTKCIDNLLNANPKFELKMALGAEVLVCEGMENMQGIELLTIAGTNTMLLELPFNSISDGIIETVGRLSERFDVVLAHIDRYSPSIIEGLFDFDLHAQLNSGRLASVFTRHKFMKYINSGRVVALGSDLHGDDRKKVKNLVTAYKKIGAENAAHISEASSKILENAEIIDLSAK